MTKKTDSNLEIATLAGGCFWCTEAIFQRLKGVSSVLPGYAGGTVANPTYEQISNGNTGHAEAIQIEFDPTQIPFAKILDIFWHTHNPTTLNQQGNDVGPQYRSIIFYHSEAQRLEAEKSKTEFTQEGMYSDPIVTEITAFTNFYPAEDYHQNYFNRNKNEAYCDVIIGPKIKKLLLKYGKDVKDEYQEA
jgi:peptide-methionine (S)-S-oxide reductase